MRILKVTLSNLNSLKGDHEVDFTKEPLASAGLYAITGPTGAGKTTLLDAITLALFGKAARYGNEKSPEAMMTKGAGECSASVVFSCKKGVFTARWGLARAHGKVDGKMQQPRRKIVAASGKVHAEQVKEADAKIEEITGLDYDRFMRSVMLAQGQFARFLASKPDERAELLEKMTGTDIYTRISILAFEESKRRDAAVAQDEAVLNNIQVLTPEEREQRVAEMQAAAEGHRSVKSKVAELDPLIGKISSLAAAIEKSEARKRDLEGFEADIADEQASFDSLARHLKTIPFADLLAQHAATERALDKRRADYESAGRDNQAAADALGVAIADFRQAQAAAVDQARQALEQAKDDRSAAVSELKEEREWLEENKHNEKLGPKLPALTSAKTAFDACMESADNAIQDWNDCDTERYPKAFKAFPAQIDVIPTATLQAAVEACLAELRQGAGVSTARLPDLRKIVELAEARLTEAKLAQQYASDRAKLEDGKPCPLCGSLHHDVRHKGSAVPVATLERELAKARKELEQAQEFSRDSAQAEKAVAKAGKALVAAQTKFKAAAKVYDDLCEELGLDSDEDVDTEALEAEVGDYRNRKLAIKDLEAAVTKADRDVVDAQKVLAATEAQAKKLKELPAGIRLGKPARNPKTIDEAGRSHDKALEAYRRAEQAVSASGRLLDQAKADHDASRKKLAAKVDKSDFDSVDDLLEAQLDQAEVTRITKLKQSLEGKLMQARADLKAADEVVRDLRRQKVPEGDEADELRRKHASLKEEADGHLRRQSESKGALAEDDRRVAERARLRKAIQTALDEVEVWRQLSALVGSADGARFRKFAQSITLDILINHANRHMGRLNDRYGILRDPNADLGLMVEDYYQGGQRRPMASLSGGESFLASLALALGLSDLAGKLVRVESLFIDEGFGTLDPETLEVALDALEGLRQGNKSIGVISHVGLLKERITTQIQVRKSSSGHSTIEVVPRM